MAETTPAGNGESLKGKILVAMPDMADPRFNRGVIVMLEHGPEGAMGVMVNHPITEVPFQDLLEQLDIPITDDLPNDYPVFFGGPVELGRGFVVHSSDTMLPHTLQLPPLAVTTSLEMLSLIATGGGPKHSIFCLGYTGWSAGQLDEEIRQNAWLHSPLSAEIIFNMPPEKRWEAALASVGVNPGFLSSEAGQA